MSINCEKEVNEMAYNGYFNEFGYFGHNSRRNNHGTSNDITPLKTSPHYYHDAEEFKKPKNCFCSNPELLEDSGYGYSTIPGLTYDYDDRLSQWDWDKNKYARKKATDDGFVPTTAKWYKAFLENYYDKKIDLIHIIAGINFSNGYPYVVFGYKVIGE
jgi:hypothetical protein